VAYRGIGARTKCSEDKSAGETEAGALATARQTENGGLVRPPVSASAAPAVEAFCKPGGIVQGPLCGFGSTLSPPGISSVSILTGYT